MEISSPIKNIFTSYKYKSIFEYLLQFLNLKEILRLSYANRYLFSKIKLLKFTDILSKFKKFMSQGLNIFKGIKEFAKSLIFILTVVRMNLHLIL
jgi:hypothetical protein